MNLAFAYDNPSAGTACFTCGAKGHFCPAKVYAEGGPVCKECFAEEPCAREKAVEVLHRADGILDADVQPSAVRVVPVTDELRQADERSHAAPASPWAVKATLSAENLRRTPRPAKARPVQLSKRSVAIKVEKVRKPRECRPEISGRGVNLTPEVVAAIEAEPLELGCKRIAKKYHLSPSTAHKIRKAAGKFGHATRWTQPPTTGEEPVKRIPEEAKEAIRSAPPSVSNKELQKKYGVSSGMVSIIRRGILGSSKPSAPAATAARTESKGDLTNVTIKAVTISNPPYLDPANDGIERVSIKLPVETLDRMWARLTPVEKASLAEHLFATHV